MSNLPLNYILGGKLMLILFQAESTFCWVCLCNPNEQPATKLCGTSLQCFKNKLIFPGRVYFLYRLVSAILMINLLPNYVAPFHRMLKINPNWFFSGRVYFLLSRWGDGDSYAANSKNILILFSRWSLFSLWGCFCNPDEQPAPRLCSAIPQLLKIWWYFQAEPTFILGLSLQS